VNERKTEELKQIQEDIVDNEKRVKDLVKTISQQKSLLITNQQKVQAFKPLIEKINAIEKTLKQQESNVSKYKLDISHLERLNNNFKAQIHHAVVCPKCKHKFLLDDEDLSTYENSIANNVEQIKQ
jgi:DNA repair exonuclease SbcCD ATPase subunit